MESKAFRMNTYKNRGEGGALLLTRFPIRESVLRSIATKDLSSHAAGNVCHVEHRDDGTFRPCRKGSASSSHPTNCVFKGSPKEGDQYDMGPTSFSTSTVSTMTMASHGQPSRKQPSGPLLRHFLQPMQRIGSIWMRPNGGLSSSGTQNMQSSTGQYSTQAGDPAHPVQHSVMTASSFGFFLRAVTMPFERGSNFCSSGTMPGALTTSGALAISRDSTFNVKVLKLRFCCRNAVREILRGEDDPAPAGKRIACRSGNGRLPRCAVVTRACEPRHSGFCNAASDFGGEKKIYGPKQKGLGEHSEKGAGVYGEG